MIRDENSLWLQASLLVVIFLSALWGTVLPDAPARNTVSLTVTVCGVTLDVSCVIRPREITTPILILKTSGNTTVNIFRNLFQLTLFQRKFTWNNAWTFNMEINLINEGLREAFVTFHAANTKMSVRSKICTFHFPHMLPQKPTSNRA